MSLFQEPSEQPIGRAVLLSIKPKYADLILAGSKRVELRRSWPSNDIGIMVIYSSAPIQKLVGVAYIDRIEECTFDRLWQIAEANGGGVTRDELKEYLGSKRKGYGVMISRVRTADREVDPKDLFSDFTPPQGFLYLGPQDYRRVTAAMFQSPEEI